MMSSKSYDVTPPAGSGKKSAAIGSASKTRQRFRPLEDLNGRGSSPLPKIYEERDQQDTPLKKEQHVLSSTPLTTRSSKTQPTPKTPKTVPRNPFEAGLVSRLHLPICSPSIFSVVVSPTRSLDGDNFDWTIEDVSRIRPANIEEHSTGQFERSEEHSPQTESKVQEAIDRYFKQSLVVPSPWAEPAQRSQPLLRLNRPVDTCTVSTQTLLSLPPILPPELEAALKPYFNEEEQVDKNEDPEHFLEEELESETSLNQSGLRRKLEFHAVETSILPDSPLMNSRWEQGQSRTNLERQICSPLFSPIASSGSPEPNPISPHLATELTFPMETFSMDHVDDDQSMHSVHGTPILGNSPQPPFH